MAAVFRTFVYCCVVFVCVLVQSTCGQIKRRLEITPNQLQFVRANPYLFNTNCTLVIEPTAAQCPLPIPAPRLIPNLDHPSVKSEEVTVEQHAVFDFKINLNRGSPIHVPLFHIENVEQHRSIMVFYSPNKAAIRVQSEAHGVITEEMCSLTADPDQHSHSFIRFELSRLPHGRFDWRLQVHNCQASHNVAFQLTTLSMNLRLLPWEEISRSFTLPVEARPVFIYDNRHAPTQPYSIPFDYAQTHFYDTYFTHMYKSSVFYTNIDVMVDIDYVYDCLFENEQSFSLTHLELSYDCPCFIPAQGRREYQFSVTMSS